MNITDVRIRKIVQGGRLRAIVSLTIDNEFAVHDIKIVEGDDRLFVAMPSRKDPNGAFRDIVHPISSESRVAIETKILDAYQAELDKESIAPVEDMDFNPTPSYDSLS